MYTMFWIRLSWDLIDNSPIYTWMVLINFRVDYLAFLTKTPGEGYVGILSILITVLWDHVVKTMILYYIF